MSEQKSTALLLSTYAHEMRNHLTIISNNTYMLSRSEPDTEVSLRTETSIQKHLSQINQLVTDLLEAFVNDNAV